MSSSWLFIESIKRRLADGTEELLQFERGVNVIVGPQNTGKSTWLKMLDYLMGGEGAPAVNFDEGLIKKYRSVAGEFLIGEKRFKLERNWSEDGARSQCLLDGEKFPASEIQSLFMKELAIPEVRYPQGNVFNDRTWPTLSWRSLLRHLYRRQDFWGELVPKQPDSEQHACLLQFLGIAEHLFSPDQAALVDAQKAVARLEAEKEFLGKLMNELAVGLVQDPDVLVGLTEESIATAESRIQSEIKDAIARRDAIIESVKNKAAVPKDVLARLTAERTGALDARIDIMRRLSEVDTRKAELSSYFSSLEQEEGRLDRVDASANVFSHLKVTHCPVCDQSVEHKPAIDAHHCFLCDQHTETDDRAGFASKRLQFERDQISAELQEAKELIQAVAAERKSVSDELARVEAQLVDIGNRLLPFQSTVMAIVPQEAFSIDQTIGSLGQQLETLKKLRVPLANRDKVSADIDKKRAEAKELEARVSHHEENIEFEAASDRLSGSLNSYLNAIKKEDPESWTKGGAITVKLDERKTRILIGDRPAKDQLGGTLTLFFIFAYHYALLSLSKFSDCHYPGFAILDLFPDIAKGAGLGERIGLVLHPFIRLLNVDEMVGTQLIMTSRDYTGDEGVNLITLSNVWR